MHTPRRLSGCGDNGAEQQEQEKDHNHQQEEEESEKKQLTAEEAIRIQRELKLHGCEPRAVEQGGRMFAAQYGSPLLMLREVESVHKSASSLRGRKEQQQQRLKRDCSVPSSFGTSYCRVEPCTEHKNNRHTSRSLLAREMRSPPFPSIAARLENDVALGLAASLWNSGNVVGHCDDRLAHLLVLSVTIVQWVRHAAENTEKPRVPLELREAFMAVIEHLVRLECVVASGMWLTLGKESHRGEEEEEEEQCSGSSTSMELSWGSDVFTSAVEGAVRVLKGLVEPATLTTATVAPVWQCSLVRTAADVPSRYDILDAMAYVLEPCRCFTVRRTFCSVARQLALEVLRDAGANKIGIRGGAAALRILQHINTRPVALTWEERGAGRSFLASLEQKTRRLTALLPPDVVDEATQSTRELVDAARLFCKTCA